MAVIDTLITRFLLDASQYTSGANQVTSATGRMASGMVNMGRAIVNIGTAAAGAAAGLVASAAALGTSAFQAFGRLESLKMGLIAVAGSSAEAEKQLTRLKAVAELPGLDLEGAIQGSVSLQAVGFSAKEAERNMKAFANAIATVGGGPSDLQGVIYGLRQLGSASDILGEDLNIIKERVPQVSAALIRLYGTARSDELAKLGIAPKKMIADLVVEMERLPTVSGGAENAVVNLGAAIKNAMAAAGKPIAEFVVPIMERLNKAFTWLAESGAIEKASKAITGMFDPTKIGDFLIRSLFTMKNTIQIMPLIFRDARQNFVDLIEAFRQGGIIALSVFVGLQLATTVLKGLALVWAVVTGQTKLATLAAIVYEAVMTKGLATAATLAIAAGVAALAYNQLNQLIPHMGDVKIGDISAYAALVNAMTEADMRKFGKWNNAQNNKVNPAAAGLGEGGGPSGGGAPVGSPAEVISSAVEANTQALERNTSTQERIVDLNRQLQGGGHFAQEATSELAIARATGRTGVRSELDQAVDLIARYVSKNSALAQQHQTRRLKQAGAV